MKDFFTTGTDVDGPTGEIIGAAVMEVHRHSGPGSLESVYEECLAIELAGRDPDVR